MRLARLVTCFAFALTLAFGSAAASDAWLHVTVDGAEDTVRVNLPLDLVVSMLPSIESEELRDGKLYIEDDELEGVDLRAMLVALNDVEDSEFITVRSDGQSVRVAKEAGFVIVKVDGDEADPERVRVRVPMEVVDALVSQSDSDGSLDLVAALDALSRFEGQDLVTVEEGGQIVRIWIDRNPEVVE